MINCLTCTASTDNMRTLSGEYWAWVSAPDDPERTGAMCPRCLREKIKRDMNPKQCFTCLHWTVVRAGRMRGVCKNPDLVAATVGESGWECWSSAKAGSDCEYWEEASTYERERNLARMQENKAKGRALGDNEGEEDGEHDWRQRRTVDGTVGRAGQ